MKVLVIDDDRWVVDVLQQVLKYENYETFSATGGLQGIALARQHRPDLIICAVMMSDMMGLNILTTLRADPVTAPIPVLFLSGLDNQAVIQQIRALGNVNYLVKPFALPEILAAVKLCVRQA